MNKKKMAKAVHTKQNSGRTSAVWNGREINMVRDSFKTDTARNIIKSDRTQNVLKSGAAQNRDSIRNASCKYAARCGGCQHIGEDYSDTLAAKEQFVAKLMRPFGVTEPIVGMETPYHYRNKVHAVLGGDRHGNIFAGTYENASHRIVPVESCLLDNELADAIVNTIVELMRSFKYKPYNEDTGRGFLRHILVRTAHSTGQVMVVLVVSEPVFPSKNNFVKALLGKHPEITTIVMNVNNRKTSMILGEREQVIYGGGFIEDELCGCRFRISPKSFYQINSVQTEALYGLAMEYAGLTGKESVIDAYCGIGTIGIVASSKAKSVTGIELNVDAIKDAKINLRLNNCNNGRYIKGDAGEFMRKEALARRHYDVVFMDPPRSGSDKTFLDAVAKLAPDRVVYISCNPETLARDLRHLTKKGYRMQKCRAVDMFPWTEHVETVCLLSKRKPDTRVKNGIDMEDYRRIRDEEKAE